MSETRIDAVVWFEVSSRRGPSRWVVVVAIMVSIALIVGATLAGSRGLTRPLLVSGGSSAEFTTPSRVDIRVRLGSRSTVPITVTGVAMTDLSGQPLPYITDLSSSPVTVPPDSVPPGSDDLGLDGAVLELTVRVDCTAVVDGYEPTQLVLTTSGTWPEHQVAVEDAGQVAGFCIAEP